MLTSQVIFMKLKKGNPKNINCQHIHGLFFKTIASQNPELADFLHSPQNIKPFSISYIYFENDMYWFRISSWVNEISEAVFEYFNSNFSIFINDCEFELIKTTSDEKESKWARRISIEHFIHDTLANPKNIFELEHKSQTSFKSGNSHIPLPVPELIVKSIYNQALFIQEVVDYEPSELINFIHLKKFKIRSTYNKQNYGSIASFQGSTKWQIDRKANEDVKNFLLLLFNVAFFTGIGVKTTQGMGMCRFGTGSF